MLQRHLNMSYSEVKNLPVVYRKWFIDRLVRDFQQRNAVYNKDKSSDANSDNMSRLKQYEDMLSNKS